MRRLETSGLCHACALQDSGLFWCPLSPSFQCKIIREVGQQDALWGLWPQVGSCSVLRQVSKGIILPLRGESQKFSVLSAYGNGAKCIYQINTPPPKYFINLQHQGNLIWFSAGVPRGPRLL